ncbi:YheC/YheD family protein [Sulfoacidibacillus thermotolerans]|uniref:ATP-grasp domain-containing protein n=1 Tax=Sulfoacidibacillus thermotolerans TaxID=1765684 RepID=A0A2U3DAF6_SULT2|nr:YheC/YheD family protein [Sulfoacidibacillus thermotolerans]PWI58251.1 hypothetical protein BM613_04815 [Sulfoacidibacillus thermotolerans]
MISQSPASLCGVAREERVPLIGIMARPHAVNGIFQGKQGPLLLRYLEAAARENAFACVFDPVDLDVERQRLRGYVLSKRTIAGERRVEFLDLGIPLVIYDQIASRRYDRSKSCTAAREYLKQTSVIFNDGYFDKWEVHTWLGAYARLRPHLPHTALMTSQDTLRMFLHAHETVFVKPIHGSLGIGIVHIEQSGECYEAVLRTKQGLLHAGVKCDAKSLYQHFKPRFRRALHIVQEGIPLARWDGRPFDIRLLMQKNHKGQWKRTKVYLRVAAKGDFTSNLTTGGQALPLSALEEESGLNVTKLKREILQLEKLIPACIEAQSGRMLGEMGIDLGVSQTGQIYVIEVNSKPWKTAMTLSGSEQLVDLSFLRPIRFALWLASARQR